MIWLRNKQAKRSSIAFLKTQMAKLWNEMQNLADLMKVPVERSKEQHLDFGCMMSKWINELASTGPQSIPSCCFRPFNFITKIVSFRVKRIKFTIVLHSYVVVIFAIYWWRKYAISVFDFFVFSAIIVSFAVFFDDYL